MGDPKPTEPAKEPTPEQLEELRKNPRGLPHAKDLLIKVGDGRVSVFGDQVINTSHIKLSNEVEAVDDRHLNPDGTFKVVRVGYISNSQVAMYARCHRLWWYEYGGERRRKPRPAIKMWNGSAIHKCLEEAGKAKMAGSKMELPDILSLYDGEFGSAVKEYEKQFKDAKGKGEELPELEFPERVNSFEEYSRLGRDVVVKAVTEIIDKVKILSVEKPIVGHLDVKTGGEVPFVGLSDLEEEDPGLGPVIMDYKTGRKRTQDDFDKDDQLTLYSILKKNPNVGWYSLVMGTTGGQNPKRAKPPEIVKLRARKTIQDQERLFDDFNFHLEGIKSGNFSRTGKHNSQICSSTLCQYYPECMGKK